MPEYMSSTVDGKFSICWNCGEQFILNPMNMKRDKPICEECSIPGLKDALEDSDSIKVTEEIVLEPNEDKPFDFAAFLAKPVPMKK